MNITKDPNMNAIEQITAAISQRGLPIEVGATGWIIQPSEFYYDSKHVATAADELKGWIYVKQNDDGYDNPSFTDIDSLIAVIKAIIDDYTDGSSLTVCYDSGEEHFISLNNDSAEGKSSEYEFHVSKDELIDTIKKSLVDRGEDITDFDEDYVDHENFLWDFCVDHGGDSTYSYTYGVAWLNFADGTSLGVTTNTDSELVIHQEN